MRAPTVSQHLKAEFTRQIHSGQWRPSEAIPTEVQLASRFGASRTAVRRALKELEAQGLLKSTQGSGRRVTPQAAIRAGTIGLLARGGEFAGGQGSRFLSAIDAQLAERGHSLLLYAIRPDEAQQSVSLPPRGADFSSLDGAIVYSPHYSLASIERLAQHISVVSAPHDATSVGVPSFIIDYGFHAAVAVQELVARGHRRIALALSSNSDRSRITAATRRGYDLGRLNTDLPLDEDLLLYYPRMASDAAYAQLYETCRQLDPPVTAVISRSVEPLQQMIRLASASDARWARQTSFVCLADLNVDQSQNPVLADFACDIEKIVRDATGCLDGMLRGHPPDKLHHTYYGTLRPCQTLRPAPSRSA